MAIKIIIPIERAQKKWGDVTDGEFFLYNGKLAYAYSRCTAIEIMTAKDIDISRDTVIEIVNVEIKVIRK